MTWAYIFAVTVICGSTVANLYDFLAHPLQGAPLLRMPHSHSRLRVLLALDFVNLSLLFLFFLGYASFSACALAFSGWALARNGCAIWHRRRRQPSRNVNTE